MQEVMVNGEFVPAQEAALHVSDLGLLRGYGMFDYFRVAKGVPMFLDDYIARFFRSAELLHLNVPFTKARLAQWVYELLERNNLRDTGMHMLLTGGFSEDGFTPQAPNFVMQTRALSMPDEQAYEQGVALITQEFKRDLPVVKSTNYAMVMRLLPKIKAQNAIDALYHYDGLVLETSRANVFVVTDTGDIITAKHDVLEGVTRKHLLDIGADLNIQQTSVPVSALKTAKEVFITSSTKGVLSITRLDDTPVADGKPGPISKELMRRFSAHATAYIDSKQHVLS